jgi:hypothetical protein
MPNWLTLRSIGALQFQDNLTDGPAIRNVRQFLTSTAETFCKQSVSFYKTVGEFPFTYRERQLHSALFPAIAKVADAAFMEQPVSRKSKTASNFGWLDYWVKYHTSVFLIELKHSWNSLRTGAISDRTQNLWTEAMEQLREIDAGEASELSLSARSTAKIALMVIPFFQTSSSESNLENFEQAEIIKAYTDLIEELSPKPDWSCLWLLHKRLDEPFDFGDRFEKYPAVAIVAKVIPILQ